MNTCRLLTATSVATLFIGLLTAGANTYQAFQIDFSSGLLDGQRFNGRITYDEKALSGIGTEFLYDREDFYDDSWSKQPNEHEGFGSFRVTIAGVGFSLGNFRSEWWPMPRLSFEDGILDGLSYYEIVEEKRDFEPNIDWVLDVGTTSAWFLKSQGFDGTSSSGTTHLISDHEGPASPLANQLGLYGTTWYSIKNRSFFTTPYADLIQVDDFDDRLLRPTSGGQILLESIFGDSDTLNSFGLTEGTDGFQSLLTNSNLLEGVTIDNAAIKTEDLVFAVDQGDGSSLIVPLSDSRHVKTYVSTGPNPGYVLWMLEESPDGDDYTHRDFNDFILLATLKAVPEPAVVITLLSVILIVAAVRSGSRRKEKTRPH